MKTAIKTKFLFCALALLATTFAAAADAQTASYLPYKTTVVRLADMAQVVVSARLQRVENLTLSGTTDAARHRRLNDGSFQDGEAGILREGVLKVSEVIKGNVSVGAEIRFVSIRQLKYEAYGAGLREGEALYFLHARPEDNRNVIIMDERGTITAADSNGNISLAADFVRAYLGSESKGAFAQKLVGAIDLKGGRLSLDACIELGWNHEDYVQHLTEEQRQQLASLARLSKSGTPERNELITVIGRQKPEGVADTLFEIMMADAHWSTTSLASNALEESGNRRYAIERLVQAWDTVKTDTERMVIVRSLGLIRPKLQHEGALLRTRSLEIVNSLLVATTEKPLLREALIAARDMRSEQAHVNALKKLIDERAINGLGDDEVKAAIIALAAARHVVESETGPDSVAVLERAYLTALGNSDPVLKQVVDSAILFPYTSLITGADGLGH